MSRSVPSGESKMREVSAGSVFSLPFLGPGRVVVGCLFVAQLPETLDVLGPARAARRRDTNWEKLLDLAWVHEAEFSVDGFGRMTR